uniref:Uncharacterized protein n=1 Tax=Anopheles minimus TaxID=112268 RepID=A0A182WPB9_9DIPT
MFVRLILKAKCIETDAIGTTSKPTSCV